MTEGERKIRVGDVWSFDGCPDDEILIVAVDNLHYLVYFGIRGKMSFENFRRDYNFKFSLRNLDEV